ncbi:MAG: hypothetical protein HYY98_13180 [Burkholderiales bacterium]|nr:hypothetical protein [Burkholderiales bacterium]
MNPLRTAAALGCALVALAGCGGGSDDAAQPPTTTLAAPTNFSVTKLGVFRWNVTPGATRYELYVDPDGAGPLAEAKANDFDQATGTGFRYSLEAIQWFSGDLNAPVSATSLAASLNASYRLRACDASGCGAFTDPKTYDIVNAVSHEFSSGRAPNKYIYSLDVSPRLSKDGLTLAMGQPSAGDDGAVYVFTRDSSTQPWQPHAVLRSGKGSFGAQIELSADGSTLATTGKLTSASDANALADVAYLYQRSGSSWNLQATLEAPAAPSACPQPCFAGHVGHLALSANGSLLATSRKFSTAPGVGSTSMGTVVTYTRSGATWSQQAVLETGGKSVELLALSGDGKTLAVNQGAESLSTPSTDMTAALVYAQQSDNTWSQQARIPVGLVHLVTLGASTLSSMELSVDGNTLAILARNSPGYQPPELDVKPTDLSCGPMVGSLYMALYSRTGSAWQRQAAISRAKADIWALARDGNALFYGNTLFTRSNGAWACP